MEMLPLGTLIVTSPPGHCALAVIWVLRPATRLPPVEVTETLPARPLPAQSVGLALLVIDAPRVGSPVSAMSPLATMISVAAIAPASCTSPMIAPPPGRAGRGASTVSGPVTLRLKLDGGWPVAAGGTLI